MAELTKIEFLPRKGVIDLRMAVEECNRENTADGDERRMAIPDIEKAETLEALGISEFYDGDYASAAEHLDLSLAFRIPQGRRSSRRLCIAYTFLGLARFRLGDLTRSDDDLQEAARIGQEAHSYDLAAIALTNRAIILGKKDVIQQAIMQSRKAIELSVRVHSQHSFEHLQHVRILVSLYMKGKEFGKAEVVLEEHYFPPQERSLLDAGIQLAQGNVERALELLQTLYHDLVAQLETTSRQATITTAASLPAHSTTGSNAVRGVGERVMRDDDEADGESELTPGEGSRGLDGHLSLLWAEGDSFLSEMAEDSHRKHQMALETLLQRAQLLYNLHLVIQLQHTRAEHSILGTDPVTLPSSIALDANRLLRDAQQLLRTIVSKLYARRLTCRERMERSANEEAMQLFGGGPATKEVSYLPQELYSHAVAMWSGVLLAQAENRMLAMQLDDGLRVQRGDVLVDRIEEDGDGHQRTVTAMAQSLDKVHVSYQAALGVLQACRAQEVAPEELFHHRLSRKGKERASSAHSPTHSSRPSSSAGKGEHERPRSSRLASVRERAEKEMEEEEASLMSEQARDVPANPLEDADQAVMQDTLRCFESFQSLQEVERVHKIAAEDALAILKTNGVEFNPSTGQLLSNANKRARTKPTAGDLATSSTASATGAAAPEGAAQGDLSSLDGYLASKVDRISARSEFIPLLGRFGRDEVAAWLMYTLAHSNGLSLGTFGISAVSGQEIREGFDAGLELEGKSPSFLAELRNRLAEVDLRLSFSFEHDEVYDFGDLEQRVIVLIVLVKLSAQLGLKVELGPILSNLLKCTHMLNRRKPCLESRVYLACAQRYKADYEEWLLAPTWMNTDERVHYLVHTRLALCKVYFQTVQDIPEVQIRKDAYKKLINTYSALHQCYVKLQSSGSVASGGSGGGSLGSIMARTLTKTELRALGASTLDQCEAGDVNWAMRHSQMRATILFEDMKAMLRDL